jgi:hypothetical protein
MAIRPAPDSSNYAILNNAFTLLIGEREREVEQKNKEKRSEVRGRDLSRGIIRRKD